MTRFERNCVSRMLRAFASFCEPTKSLAGILQATIDLSGSSISHIADMPATIAAGRLVDVSGGTDGDLERFRKDHVYVFLDNPVVPALSASRSPVIANSELVGSQDWRASKYLNEFLRPCGVEDGTLVLPRYGATLSRYAMGIGHPRSRPIKRRVRRVLEWLEPAIRQGFYNIEAWDSLSRDRELLRRGIAQSDEAIAVICDGKIHSLSPSAVTALSVGTVVPSRDLLLQDFVDNVRRARASGKFRISFSGRGCEPLDLDMLDISDTSVGTGTIVRITRRADLARSLTNVRGRALKRGLTARQADVFALLAVGRSDREIARILKISLPTARTHLRTIYERLRVSNRVEALSALL